MSIEDLRQL